MANSTNSCRYLARHIDTRKGKERMEIAELCEDAQNGEPRYSVAVGDSTGG